MILFFIFYKEEALFEIKINNKIPPIGMDLVDHSGPSQ